MKRAGYFILTIVAAVAFSACRHASNTGDTSGGGNSASGGALPAAPSDSMRMVAHPKTPAMTDTLNKGLRTDSIKKNQ
ncbi:MAG TPA: hypothetical protein VHB54_21990 [Mucilaginibacter sp.]|nr:hypothetical protein [Mucilaginibacter sp.]